MEYLLERLTVFDLIYQGLVVAIVGFQLPGLKTWQWLLLYLYLLVSLLNPLLVTHSFAVFHLLIVLAVIYYWQTRQVNQVVIRTALSFLYIALIEGFYLLCERYLPQASHTIYLSWELISLIALSGLTRLQNQLYQHYIADSIRRNLYLMSGATLLMVALYAPTIFQDWERIAKHNQPALIFLVGINLYLVIAVLGSTLIFYYGLQQVRLSQRDRANQAINQQYSEMMTQQYTEMRKYRHDMNNLLLGLDGLIQARAWDQLQDYTQQLHQDLQLDSQNAASSLGRLVYLKNIELRNLVYVKLSYALSLGTPISLELHEGLPDQLPHPLSWVRIIGILLDNAIEESRLVDDPQIQVAFLWQEPYFNVIVANRCQDLQTTFEYIQTPGASSKGSHRGQGLENLKELTTKAGWQYYTTIDDQQLVQEIVAQLPKQNNQ